MSEIPSSYFQTFKSGFHAFTDFYEKHMLVPKFVVKCVQLGTAILVNFPPIAPFVEWPRKLSFQARNIINVLRGFKTTDGILNYKADWRSIALNVVTATLFVLSSLILLEQFNLYEATALKTALAALPIFGALPFGGLYLVSMTALGAIFLSFALEKRKGLKAELEKEANLYLIACCVLFIARQILTMAAKLTRYTFALSLIAFGVDLVGTGLACKRYFVKKRIAQEL